MINATTLQQKLESLKTFPRLKAEMIDHFGAILQQQDDWDLLRINPYTFAKRHHLNQTETLDLFIHAVKVGLFDFKWNMICPSCGGVEYNYNSVNEVLANGFFCTVCRIDAPGDLDDRVEVSFTINPTIKKLNIEPYRNPKNYNRYFFSENMIFSKAQTEHFEEIVQTIHALKANEIVNVTLHLLPNQQYTLISLLRHQMLDFFTADIETTDNESIVVDLLPTGIAPQGFIQIPAGEVTFQIHNRRPALSDVVIQRADKEVLMALFAEHTPYLVPMLTGKQLLNQQTFRDLFRVQNLKSDLYLNIRSLTLLFTDLKGSTDLYDNTGDAFAYNLIQEHFTILTEAVRHQGGAIVKTMGDAIMATFSTPQEGVQAAIDMVKGMAELNARLRSDGHELGLKIGLHEGNALAVNADDRFDYFGQTVNIAARVQGLAKADEIWVTKPILEAVEVADIFEIAGYQANQHQVRLKGVREETTVYCLHQPLQNPTKNLESLSG